MKKHKQSRRTQRLVAEQKKIERALAKKGRYRLSDDLIARNSEIHGRGVFARRDIPADADLIEYVGEKISKKEATRRGRSHAVYIFVLNERRDVDGWVGGNGAHLVNHSCAPNAEAVVDDDEIWIRSIREIRQGEEITYDYGFEFENYADYPCLCGRPQCRGYMVDAQYARPLRRRLKQDALKRRR